MSSKREASLKTALFKQLLKDEPTFLVLQIATAGCPDRAVVGNKITSYWEAKHGTPLFVSQGNQRLMCQRLANQGYHCRYIIWVDHGSAQYTLIVHPLNIDTTARLTPEVWIDGHNHKMVSDYIRKVHRGDYH